MKHTFNMDWNKDYNFSDPENIKEIEKVECYDFHQDHEIYSMGQSVESPWGINHVIKTWHDNGTEFCQKRITIYPGFMLSLQRHRGREENWKVLKGVLTVILNGNRHDIKAGEEIFISKGSPHCMINVSHEDVIVEEVQSGICRERDNIRLVDFSNRPTYPLTTHGEYLSALLYREIMQALKNRN